MAPYVGMVIEFDTPAPRRDEEAPRGGTGSQVLPVAELADDFDGNPDDGMEYLFLVRREASTHPAVHRAINPYAIEEDNEPGPRRPTPEAPDDRPSEAWRAAFVKHFEGLRARMASVPPESTFPPPHYGEIPSARDESGWRVFINGRRLKRETAAKAVEEAPKELTLAEAKRLALASLEMDEEPAPPPPPAPIPTPAPFSEPDSFDPDHPPHFPSPALLLAINQPTMVHIISHINDWLVERSEAHETTLNFVPSTIFAPRRAAVRKTPGAPITVTKASLVTNLPPTPPLAKRAPLPSLNETQWILSILSSLDSLLAGDDISILRTICKTLIALVTVSEAAKSAEDRDGVKLSREDEDEAEQIAMCWMVVAAVASTWGQGDLWNSNL
ncbi:gem associated protein 2, partial [Phenoliferia sp. Uapishka_3]